MARWPQPPRLPARGRSPASGRTPSPRSLRGPAYLVHEGGDEWRPVSWAEAAQAVDELAHGLLALGIRKGDAFAILASHPPRVGALRLRARPDRRGRRSDLHEQLAEGRARTSPGTPRRSAPFAKTTSSSRSSRGSGSPHLLTFADLDALRERGRAHAAEHPDAVEQAAAAIDENDLFTFIYTSGTTGPPKACMILHRNYYAMVDEVRQVEDFTVSGDVMLLYLPLAHNFGRCLDAPRRTHRLHASRSVPTPTRSATRCPRCGRPSSRACRASTRRCTPPFSPSSKRRPERSGG